MSNQIQALLAVDPVPVLSALNGTFEKMGRLSKTKRRRLNAFQKHLSRFIDPWIDSGRRPDGSEAPGERKYGDVHSLGSLTRAAYTLWINLPVGAHAPAIGWKGPKGPVPAEFEARAVATEVLAAEWRFSIAKCRHCGKYFLLPIHHQPVYQHGLFCCTKHNRHATAVRLKRVRRDHAIAEVLQRARLGVRHYDGRGPWHKDVFFKKELAEKLTDFIRARIKEDRTYPLEHVRSNWLTLNHRLKKL